VTNSSILSSTQPSPGRTGLDPGSRPDPDAEALVAATAFGMALRDSPEFTALAAARAALFDDPDAQAAIRAIGERERELRTEIMLGMLSDAAQAELEQLRAALYEQVAVTRYAEADQAVRALCVEAAAVVSDLIGADFAANARTGGCCG